MTIATKHNWSSTILNHAHITRYLKKFANKKYKIRKHFYYKIYKHYLQKYVQKIEHKFK